MGRPKTKIEVTDPRVKTISDATDEVIAVCTEWVELVRRFHGDTGLAIATPSEIYHVGGLPAMIAQFRGDMTRRLGLLQEISDKMP